MVGPTLAGNRRPGGAGPIAVVYDSQSEACARAVQLIEARERSLPLGSATARLIPWPSPAATAVLAEADDCLREMNLGHAFSMAAQMVAVLPSGLVLPGCQDDVMQLIAEMEYLALVCPPRPEVSALVERHMAPLRRMRAAGCAGAWWRPAAAVERVAGALQEACFCVLDGFLPLELAEQLAEGVWNSRPVGPVGAEGKNGWTRGGTARAAEAIHSGGGLEERNERLARALLNPSRGDVALFSDGDHHLQGTSALCAAVDELVVALKDCPTVAQRLTNTDFANSAMFTVYPGGASRYIKHTDNSALTDGRRLTAILYLNKSWELSHGGQLRIFEPTMQSVRVKADVEPLFNRLVVFWSTEEVPHEVLPSYRERAAVSIWYCCAKECLQTEEAFKRLACKARCVAGRSRADRLEAAGWTQEQRRLLRLLGEPPSHGTASEHAQGQEREAVLAAATHDFGGCEVHRRQRERLNQLFGWDARVAEVRRQVLEAQLQQLSMFEAMGLPPPVSLERAAAGGEPELVLPQTSAPALTEEFCRRSGEGRHRTAPTEPQARGPPVSLARAAAGGEPELVLPQTSAPALTEELCRRGGEGRHRRAPAEPQARGHARAADRPRRAGGLPARLPDKYEAVD